jgi:predicted thioesterase
VLATPALAAFCEECARLAIDPLLPTGQQTVGTRITLHHRAATPLGLEVRVRATLEELDGKRLRFRIEAWDDVEVVCEVEHERYIIDVQRFQQRVAEKASRVRAGTERAGR